MSKAFEIDTSGIKSFEMTLNSPLTKEDWAKITDANMEHTTAVKFQTEGGKEAEFMKVVRCKDCKHGTLTKNALGETMVSCWHPQNYIESDWLLNPDFYCADGERK